MMKFVFSLLVFVSLCSSIVCEQFDSKTCVLSPTVMFMNYTFINDNNDTINRNLSLFGLTTVFAFVDSIYGFEQVKLLKILQKRLKRSNFENIQFILINSYESQGDIDGLKHMKQIAKDMYIFQETSPEVAIIFGYSVIDSVFITDSCGRITYHVIPPWSFAQYPYVKAAILSTILDDPCGPCYQSTNDTDFNLEISKEHLMTLEINELKTTMDEMETSTAYITSDLFTDEAIEISTVDSTDLFQNSTNIDDLINFSNLTEDISVTTDENFTKDDTKPDDDDDNFYPFKIILHTPHIHINCEKMLKYEYLVLQFGNNTFHDHLHEPVETVLDSELINDLFERIVKGKNIIGEEFVYLDDGITNCSTIQKLNITFTKEDEDLHGFNLLNKSFGSQENFKIHHPTNDDQVKTKYQLMSNGEEEYDNVKQDIFEHYSKLLNWLNVTL